MLRRHTSVKFLPTTSVRLGSALPSLRPINAFLMSSTDLTSTLIMTSFNQTEIRGCTTNTNTNISAKEALFALEEKVLCNNSSGINNNEEQKQEEVSMLTDAIPEEVDSIDFFLRVIQSEPLSKSERGRQLKQEAAKILATIFSNALADQDPSFRVLYLQNPKENVEYGDSSLTDVVSIIKQAMLTQVRDYKVWMSYFQVLGALYMTVDDSHNNVDNNDDEPPLIMTAMDLDVHYSWLLPKLSEMLRDLNNEHALFMEKKWPIAEAEIRKRDNLAEVAKEIGNGVITVDHGLIYDLESERSQLEEYFRTFAKSLAYLVIPSQEARVLILNHWSADLLEPLPGLMDRILRYDFEMEEVKTSSSSSSSSSSSQSSKTSTMVVEGPSNATVKSDAIVFQLLGTFITFANEDRDNESMNKVCNKAFRIVPFSVLAKCIHVARDPRLVRFALKYVYDGMQRGVWSPEDVIFKNDDFLRKLGYLLTNSHVPAVKAEDMTLALATSLLMKSVAFFFSTATGAQLENVRSAFYRWQNDLSWLIRCSKRLEHCGILEACFQHLKTFDEEVADMLEDTGTFHTSTHIFAFTVIECCVFAEGLTKEAEKAIQEDRESENEGRISSFKWNNGKSQSESAQEYGIENSSSAVLHIRKNVPDAVQILQQFARDAPERAFRDCDKRLEACLWAIMTKEQRDEAAKEPKEKKKKKVTRKNEIGSLQKAIRGRPRIDRLQRYSKKVYKYFSKKKTTKKKKKKR